MLLLASTYLCAQPVEHEQIDIKTSWMGELSLSFLEDGASFQLQGFVERETWVPLPGEIGSWPYLVQENEQNLFIIEQNGIPHTLLRKGHHNIQGMFSWIEMPHQLRIPKSIVFVHVQKENHNIPFLRLSDRIWVLDGQQENSLLSPKEELSITRKMYEQKIETILSIQSTGRSHIYEWPISLVEGSTLFNIQSQSPYWYKQNTLFMLLEEGEHTFIIQEKNAQPPTTLENKAKGETWIVHSLQEESIFLQRSILRQEEYLYITDNWSGIRTKDHLLYPQNNPTLLKKGDAKQIHMRRQLHTEEMFATISSENVHIQTKIHHPASIRAFSEWPIVAFLLWFLLCLILWKQDSIRHRRYFALASFPAIFLSSASLLFLIGICSVFTPIKTLTNKKKETLCLVVAASWMGIIAQSIAPSELISFTTHNPNDLFWLESSTIMSLACISLVGIGILLWRNLIILGILLFCFLSSSQKAYATTGFPLCSISLEEENITISGQIHQTQAGEWIAPGPVSSITPQKISIDGQSFSAFRLTEDRFLALYLEEGIFEFVIEGTYTAPFSVYFPERAEQINFSSSTHQVEGIRADLSHEKTLFFWKESPPEQISSPPQLNIHVFVQSSEIVIDFSIQNHTGTETYGLPSWYAEEEIPTKESQTLFASHSSYSWQEKISTPSSLRFIVPENEQYRSLISVECALDVLCMHNYQAVQANSIWNQQESILIRPVSPTDHHKSLFLLPQQCYSTKDSLDCMAIRKNTMWLKDSIDEKEWDIAYDRDPETTFFVLTSAHQQYMCFSLLLCCVFSFILAKNQSSRLNLSEWLWISIGSYIVHPLLLPLSIIFVLYLEKWYVHLLYILVLLAVVSIVPLGTDSWHTNAPVLCIPTEILTYLLWIWILGIFFFLQSFQFAKQSMEIGRSESG